ncbi:MAG: hypothetical protein M3O50_02195 [Myxococcota bacterium]|nr:hypothetical protein [Myxococcota bacterium]
MLDYAGSLQRIALSRTLWLIAAWPAVGFAWQVLVVRRRVALARGERATNVARASGRFAGIAFLLLATSTTLAHFAVLEGAPGEARVLLEEGPFVGRFGWLDAHVALCFDALAAWSCSYACAVSLVAALVLSRRAAAQRGWKEWAWLHLALEGALLTFLADGFVATALGWAIAAAAGAWLAGWRYPRRVAIAATRSGVGLAGLLVGAAVLFWGLAGSWNADDFSAEASPRLVVVRHGSPSRRPEDRSSESRAVRGRGTLTFAFAPGAMVFVDDARSPSFRAPFVRADVEVGTHVFHVRRDTEPDDEVVGPVHVADGDELALVPVGPSLSFRAIADQLTLRDVTGKATMRSALEERFGPGGSAVAAAALAAWLIAAVAMSGSVRCGGAPPELMGSASACTSAALGPYLLARVFVLFPLAPHMGGAVAWLGGAMWIAAIWRALAFAGQHRWVTFAGGTPAALGCVALGVGGVVDAMRVMGLAGLVAGAAHAHASWRTAAWEDAKPERDAVESVVLADLPERVGGLLVRMDRWVIDAVARATAGLVRAVAWTHAEADRHLVSAPADAAATQLVRAVRAAEPFLGGSPVRMAWALIVAAALAGLTSALRGGG